jgi:hypothetical protein
VNYQLCPETDMFREHHDGYSHNLDPESDIAKASIENVYGKAVADLARRLDAVVDPITGKTLLDKTLMVWVNSAGAILRADTHNWLDIPTLIVTGSSKIRTGVYIDYRNHNEDRADECCDGFRFPYGRLGLPYNSLLVTCLEAMGLTKSLYLPPGVSTFGDTRNNDYNQYKESDMRVPLPFLLKS